MDGIKHLLETNTSAKGSIKRAGLSHADTRIKSIISIAPVHSPALTQQSLKRITIPVSLYVGANDTQAVPADNAQAIDKLLPRSQLTLLPNVGHYTFLAPCTFKGRLLVKNLCADNSEVDRSSVHQQVARQAVTFFRETL